MNLETRIRSTAMRGLSSAGFLGLQRGQARLRERLTGQPKIVHYFHQVDDPYSHLAVQKLDALKQTYAVRFEVHLVSKPEAPFQGSSAHFDQWALSDAASVASAYGTEFPENPRQPDASLISAANDVLAAHLAQADFAIRAAEVGRALWSGRTPEGNGNADAGQQSLAGGNALRRKLGHYLGGMFYFEGEWFWGVDRIRLLEARLTAEGLSNPGSSESLCVPEPTARDTSGMDTSRIQLEYFPSLRSPYTAIGHQRVLDLIERSGVSVQLRPVMPMLMRGIPAPQAKQRYIITDAGREARARGVPFGRIVDPFGEPVRRAFALFPGAQALGRGMAFVTAYLAAAWADGVDITTDKGLQTVAENAGIGWAVLQAASRGAAWEAMLDSNLEQMLNAGLWGVPSFRVTGGNSSDSFACWGQDRIWRVENEIASRV